MSMRTDIKEIVDKAGWNFTKVVRASNKNNGVNFTLQNFSQKLKRETITYKEILEVAEIIGYKLEWVKKETDE